MRDAFRTFVLMILAVLVIAALGALTRPAATQMASSLELIARPDTVLQLEAQRQQAALAAAQVQAQTQEAQAAAVTLRLGLVLVAIVMLALVGGVIVTLRDAPRRRDVLVLLPDDPRFSHALHLAGGQRINGVPLLDGREVAELQVVDAERR